MFFNVLVKETEIIQRINFDTVVHFMYCPFLCHTDSMEMSHSMAEATVSTWCCRGRAAVGQVWECSDAPPQLHLFSLELRERVAPFLVTEVWPLMGLLTDQTAKEDCDVLLLLQNMGKI